MLIGFNNIHFSWKETILLIEERRERREERGGGGVGEEGALFIFKCVHEMTLLKKRSTGSELMKLSDAGRGKKGKPKLKAIYFHWGMWLCSGTINGLSVDTEIWRWRERKSTTEVQRSDWWHRWVKRESKNKTLGRLTAMIPIIAFLLVNFFFLQ